ncbi:hypothetical protein INT48_006619 [Thamnidium elegans]|uniref:Uncharacterized protein n=1 Tax=Thamnidium elegans TaxID=101142 RepID=A0A8H7VXR7_9FUNG|nr:hypothetical protein INT48_006619 [Thamnidium elegans]
MQRHMVKLWSDWLGSTVLLGELEAVASTSYISPAFGHYAAAARLLHIVLSIKCLVALKHMKLIAMINVIEKYSNEHLDSSADTDQPYVTFYGSSQKSQKSTKEREGPEYVQEALLESISVKHLDEIVGASDWEKMLIDDVNQEMIGLTH